MWNPESKTVLNSLTWGETKASTNREWLVTTFGRTSRERGCGYEEALGLQQRLPDWQKAAVCTCERLNTCPVCGNNKWKCSYLLLVKSLQNDKVSPFQTDVFLSCCIIVKSSKSRKEHILFACRTKQNQVGHPMVSAFHPLIKKRPSDWPCLFWLDRDNKFSNSVLNDISHLWTVLLLVVTSYTPITLKLFTFIHVFRTKNSFFILLTSYLYFFFWLWSQISIAMVNILK